MTYTERIDTFMAALGLGRTYRVGGSVRDEVLDRRVKDCDYVVFGETLDEIRRRLFAKDHLMAFEVSPLKLRDGRQAGWRISGKGLGLIEIVLPRTEVSTGPGHRDFEIVLDPDLSLAEDAKRRDFTFNALYKPIGFPADGPDAKWTVRGDAVIDPTRRGLHDLEHRLVNVTHADSFRDDPLRTLRALRFVSTLGYELGAETRALMALYGHHVTGLSAKGYASGTVLTEMNKLLMGANAVEALRIMRDTKVMQALYPELMPMIGFDQSSRYHDLTTDEHTFKALETAVRVDAPLRVRWALLFHDSGKPDVAWTDAAGRKHYYGHEDNGFTDHEDTGADKWLDAASWMGVPRDLYKDVEALVRNHMVPVQKVNEVKVRRARVRLGDDMLRDLYMMRLCDLTGKDGKADASHMQNIVCMEQVRQAAQDAGVPASAKDLAIRGRDVVEAGAEGRKVGEILSTVLDEVVADPSDLKLTRDWQISRVEALS